MRASADSLDFVPPPEPAAAPAFALALIAHLMLLIGLAWGIHWQKESHTVAEAELWASMPQPVVVPPPPPQPAKPAVIEKPAPPPPVVKEPDIALEREKQRREEAQRRAREEEARKQAEAKKKQEEAERLEAQRKAAEEKKKQQELAKRKLEEEAKKLAALRQENLERMLASAAGGGTSRSPGTGPRSSGSPGYGARIAARIKPNIVFTDLISGNPTATVRLRVAPDGTIVGRRLVKPSGVPSWDEAVLRAIDKTGSIPRDTDGRVAPDIEIDFRPKD